MRQVAAYNLEIKRGLERGAFEEIRKKIFIDIADHQGDFAIIYDVLPVILQDKLKAWLKSL